MGGTYRQESDYLIPNLVLPDTGDYQLGKYGRMRRRYLKEHHKVLYTNLLTSGAFLRSLTGIIAHEINGSSATSCLRLPREL